MDQPMVCRAYRSRRCWGRATAGKLRVQALVRSSIHGEQGLDMGIVVAYAAVTPGAFRLTHGLPADCVEAAVDVPSRALARECASARTRQRGEGETPLQARRRDGRVGVRPGSSKRKSPVVGLLRPIPVVCEHRLREPARSGAPVHGPVGRVHREDKLVVDLDAKLDVVELPFASLVLPVKLRALPSRVGVDSKH